MVGVFFVIGGCQEGNTVLSQGSGPCSREITFRTPPPPPAGPGDQAVCSRLAISRAGRSQPPNLSFTRKQKANFIRFSQGLGHPWLRFLSLRLFFLSHSSFFLMVSACLKLGSLINLFPASRIWGVSILQGIFLKSNQDLLHCRWILYQLSYQGSPHEAEVGTGPG